MDAELSKEKFKSIYNNIESPLWCPALTELIYLTAKGFHHLLYDGLGNKRYAKTVQHKLKVIPYISECITSGKVTSYRKLLNKTPTEYWGLEATIDKVKPIKIRIILRKIGNGKIIFWSIMGLKSKNKKNLL